MSEALEWVERARGRLSDFHQMMGRADLLFGEAADALAEAGADDLARRIHDEVVGRDVLEGRWTFQVVEESDRLYYGVVRRADRDARHPLTGDRRHVYEAEMKAQRQSGTTGT